MTKTLNQSLVLLDRQVAEDIDDQALPSETQLIEWLNKAINTLCEEQQEITVRFVSEQESAQLNGQYRNKPKPTNVLSFPFESPPGLDLPLLGDLVICQAVIEQEALAQQKPLMHHYAHMVVHGCLHLFGYDHIEDGEAEQMESLEISLLNALGIDDPYQDH